MPARSWSAGEGGGEGPPIDPKYLRALEMQRGKQGRSDKEGPLHIPVVGGDGEKVVRLPFGEDK